MLKKIFCILICLLLLFAAGCRNVSSSELESSSEPVSSLPESSSVSVPESSSEPEPEPEPTTATISFVAAGDNLIHDTLFKQAANRAGGVGYDFDAAYEHIESLIADRDIAVLNQETMIASPPFEPSSYPLFSSPREVGIKMLELGFNSFNHANNHVLDKGVDGINACLDFWDEMAQTHDIAVTGVWRDTDDMNNIKTLERNGVTFAFLGFTQFLNGLIIPSGADERVVTTDEFEEVERLIRAAEEKADVVVVSVHWGIEDSNIVTDYQKDLARKMVSWGADIIAGTHPHVLQSMEYIEKEDGTKALVTYSLGNFISAQRKGMNLIGGVVTAEILFDFETGAVDVNNTVMHPVVTHYDAGMSNIRVYPRSEYTAELAAVHGGHSFLPEWSMTWIDSVIAEAIPAEFLTVDLVTEE